MSLRDSLRELRGLDLAGLDLNDLGAWPAPLRAICAALLCVLVLALGWQLHLSGLQAQLERQRGEEQALKEQFAAKAFQAAHLETLRAQLEEMQASFGTLLRQLPGDTEVPGLLEDITRIGLDSGLTFEEIRLLPEETRPFYIELPIRIRVVGGYHELATFVSGVAGLSRIVTLHDFDIRPLAGAGSRLGLNILARTYRYSDREVQP